MSMKWLTVNSSQTIRTKSALIVMLALITMFASACSILPDEDAEEVLPTITPPKISKKPEYPVTTGELRTTVRANGKVMSKKEEPLFFIDASKPVKEIYVVQGQKVEAGEVLAELDTTDAERDLKQKKLQMRGKELEMIKTLRQADELPPEELEQAKINFELAKLELEKLEVAIANAQLTAPFSGQIVDWTLQKGDTVTAYKSIGTLSDPSQLVVAANVNSNDLPKIAVGMETEVDINGIGMVKGKVKQLPTAASGNGDGGNDPNQPGGSPQRDNINKYVLIELEKPVELVRLTPLSATVIISRKQDAVLIPLAALRTHNGRTYVQVMEQDGTKREVDVQVGQQTSTEAEILSGLKPGQKVVGR